MASPIQLGTVAGAPIIAEVDSASLAVTRKITLSQTYDRAPPSDYPTANPGSPGNLLAQSAAVFAPGAVLTLFSDEAAALVAAGAAAYS